MNILIEGRPGVGKTTLIKEIAKKLGERAGKYKVNVPEFEKIALPAIKGALFGSKVIIIDEIGPMELFSQRFKEAVLEIKELAKTTLTSIRM